MNLPVQRPDEPEGADEVEASRAPLIEHLLELRRRLIYCLLALGIAFAGAYYFAPQIYQVLVRPYAKLVEGQPGRTLIFTAPQEAFFTDVKVAFFASIAVTLPIILNQLWKFVAPGLYRHERRAFWPFLAATPLLFAAGAAMVYFMVWPLALKFFLSFETTGGSDSLPIMMQPKVSEYLGTIMTLILAFGVGFQTPVALVLLGRVGILTSADLRSKRRYAIVLSFILAAILTPPDMFSMTALALPLCLLYEASVWIVWWMERSQAQATIVPPGP